MTSNSAKPGSVVILTYPQAKLLDIAGPLQVFADARHYGADAYRTVLVTISAQGGATDAGVTLSTEPASAWVGKPIGTLLVAGGPGANTASNDPSVVETVRSLAGRAGRIGSICTGALVLAAAGLLEGRRAVTHWESCARLAETYPGVRVEPDQIYVRDGPVWTSAGVTAGIDMALAMVGEDHGRAVAMALARSLVTFMVRPGGQSQFSRVLELQTQDISGRFDALHHWISDHLTENLRVERLAERARMSARSFARIYSAETGLTPAKAVEQFRVDAACRLLEESGLSVSQVAVRCGFMDDERLRRAMQRVLSVSPSEYRERFGAEDQGAVAS
ncbi:MAG: helix-turn-helix domain-containing protein [Pseudomonadota bacterium]